MVLVCISMVVVVALVIRFCRRAGVLLPRGLPRGPRGPLAPLQYIVWMVLKTATMHDSGCQRLSVPSGAWLAVPLAGPSGASAAAE